MWSRKSQSIRRGGEIWQWPILEYTLGTEVVDVVVANDHLKADLIESRVHFGKCQGGSTIENGCFDIGKGTDGKGKEK